jgi:hypothetical protein
MFMIIGPHVKMARELSSTHINEDMRIKQSGLKIINCIVSKFL